VGIGVKQFQFTWTDVADADFYRLLESPDGVSTFNQVGGAITAGTTSRTLDIAVHRLGPFADATFRVDACNSGGCTASNVVTTLGGVLQAIGYIKASNPDANDTFGGALALSSDGNTLAVGAIGEDSNATGVGGSESDNSATFAGAVYVYTHSSGGLWSQQAYIKASNPDANDAFGGALALSSDGNTLAVGAISEDSSATGVGGSESDNSASGAGAVYVYTRSSGGVWSQQAYIKASNTEADDTFGRALALSSNGNTLAVGAIGEDSPTTGVRGGGQGDNSAGDSGAAYIYTRSSGSVWSQQAYIKASNTQANDAFGGAVALSGDGRTLAVGAVGEDSNAPGVNGVQGDNSASGAGAVYVYTGNSAGEWPQQGYIKAPNAAVNDAFGGSVALSSDGNALAVGASSEDGNATGVGGSQDDNSASGAGAAYLY
jgi:hypothetical protein